MRRPELEFRVAARAESDEIRVAARDHVERNDDLAVAPVEPFGQPQHRCQRPHRAAQPALQHAVALVGLLRRRLPVVAREQRDDLDLLRIEATQLPVFDQIVRVPVVAFVTDMDPRVVEQRAVFQPLAFAIPELVHRPRLVENGEREL